MAWMGDLSEARVERGLQHGGWLVGAQLQPGAEPGLLIVWRVVGELDAQMPATGKTHNEHRLVDPGPLHRAHRTAPEGALKAPGQLLAPVRARKDVNVAAESDHFRVHPSADSVASQMRASQPSHPLTRIRTSGHAA